MSEYIYDPIEAALEDFLNEVQTVPAYVTAPKTLPERFIQVVAVGGGEAFVTQSPMVTFSCWDVARGKAARLSETILAHMRGCRELNGLPIYRVRTVGLPVYRPDESGKFRYQFTLELQVRGRDFSPA